jgi:hypothetical protein
MVRLAKHMQNALKAALHIKSPSRVFADLAEHIPAGVAMGVDRGTPRAVASINRMSRAGRLGRRRDARRPDGGRGAAASSSTSTSRT